MKQARGILNSKVSPRQSDVLKRPVKSDKKSDLAGRFVI